MPIARTKSRSTSLMSLLFVVGRRMKEEMKESGRKSRCSWLHFEVMRYVGSAGKPLMRDVAEHFSVTPPAATLLIEAMVEAGLLRRVLDPKDRRAVRVALTAKANQLLKRGMQDRTAAIKRLFSVLDSREERALLEILTKVAGPEL